MCKRSRVEQLVTQLRVEAFAIAVLPRAAWFDVSRLGSNRCDPILHGGRCKFGAIIGRHRLAADDEIGRVVQIVAGDVIVGSLNACIISWLSTPALP
jgi:hypothetical protein